MWLRWRCRSASYFCLTPILVTWLSLPAHCWPSLYVSLSDSLKEDEIGPVYPSLFLLGRALLQAILSGNDLCPVYRWAALSWVAKITWDKYGNCHEHLSFAAARNLPNSLSSLSQFLSRNPAFSMWNPKLPFQDFLLVRVHTSDVDSAN